jgi:hypothetical protein
MLKDIPQTFAKFLISFKADTTVNLHTSYFVYSHNGSLLIINKQEDTLIAENVTLLHIPKTITLPQAAAEIYNHIQKPFYTLNL